MHTFNVPNDIQIQFQIILFHLAHESWQFLTIVGM